MARTAQHEAECRDFAWLSWVCVMLVMLYSMGLSVAVGEEHNPVGKSIELPLSGSAPLEGKRLFFDQRQRDMLDSGKSVSSETPLEVANGSMPKKAPDRITIDAAPKHPGPVPRIRVQYDALIKSDNTTRVVVNGVPCQRINHSIAAAVSVLTLECVAFGEPELQLQLMSDRVTIKVMQGTVVLGSIGPGQQL